MARTRVAKLAFNRGLVSRLGLARADIKRLAMAAEIQINWMTRTLGSMMIRPGTEHLGSSRTDQRAFHIPFVFAIDDKASIELTNQAMRVWVNDVLITRAAVSSAVTNGAFNTDLTGWTDNDEVGATSAWSAGGYMGLGSQNGTSSAIRDQIVAVSVADQGVEHALHIVIARGPVTLRVGSSTSTDNYISETRLETGAHSLAFTPTGNFNIRFMTTLKRNVLVDSCVVEAAGVMAVETPWLEADLRLIRHDQSGDVVFVACGKTTDRIGYQQRRIERRATRSWSVATYYTEDGPFMVPNGTTITMTADSSVNSLVSSVPYFKTTNVGSIFKINPPGQTVTATITAQNQFTDTIRVTGVGNDRVFVVSVSEDPVGAATFTLQRSLIGEDGPWTDAQQWTADAVVNFDDGLANQIAWYRIGVKTGDYGSGTHFLGLQYGQGSIAGVVRVTAFINSQQVSIETLSRIGQDASPTTDWAEGQWSDRRGWPTCVAFHEGRLTWHGRDRIIGSISDAFDSFDEDFEGDAGPFNRTIGSGPVDTINWALSMQRLLLGGQGAEFSVRSSSLDEPLTPTNFNLKAASTQGSAPVAAVRVDQSALHVQRGGTRVYELAFGQTGIDYESSHLTALVPDIGLPGIVKVVVQRQPDTRAHFLRSDGTVAVVVFDRLEQVICWLELETDGEIEDADVLPGDPSDEEDFVYYSVKRTINGVTKRFREKWAFEAECRGDAQLCMLADSFVSYTGVPTTTVSAPHLAGEQVVIWADGADVGTDDSGNLIYTLDGSGNATLPVAVTNYVVGLPYSAPWKSAKLVELMEQLGGSLISHQQIKALGLILADVHAKGLKYGHSLVEAEMRDLPLVEATGPVDPDSVRTDYAAEKMAFPGEWSTDARLCLLAKAPRPVTVLAALAELEFHG